MRTHRRVPRRRAWRGLITLSEYNECLVLQHERRVDELLVFEAPRAQELLQRVGCDLEGATCGLPTPTPTPS